MTRMSPMTIMRACASALVLAMAGCASQPDSSPPAQPAESAAALAQPAAAAQAEHTDDVTHPANVDADKIMAAQRAGYKIVQENGETLFCKRQKQTGSRLRENTMCLTSKEWERATDSTRQTLQDIARQRPPRRGT